MSGQAVEPPRSRQVWKEPLGWAEASNTLAHTTGPNTLSPALISAGMEGLSLSRGW